MSHLNEEKGCHLNAWTDDGRIYRPIFSRAATFTVGLGAMISERVLTASRQRACVNVISCMKEAN